MKRNFSQSDSPLLDGELTHADVSRWMLDAMRSDSPAAPPEAICAHVAGCARCRGALLATIVEATQVARFDQDITCEQCIEDLPAFIDQEQADPGAALRDYPHVWWHLWICGDCAGVYQMTCALVEAQQAGEIEFPELAEATNPGGAPSSLIALARAFLDFVFSPATPAFAPARGSEQDPILLTEEPDGAGRMVTVSVHQQPDGAWGATIEVDPPMSGAAVLRMGEWSSRQPLSAQGVAEFADIPAALLTGPDGPDLLVELEPEG